MHVMELFNGPVPYKWKRENNDWIATFLVQDKEFESSFSARFGFEKPEYIFAFEYLDADDTHANTGQGNEFTVFATVIKQLKEFLAKKKPQAIEFYGDKSDGKGKLYDFMIKRMRGDAAALGYTVVKSDSAHEAAKVYRIEKVG
jgi:hypothetical protein